MPETLKLVAENLTVIEQKLTVKAGEGDPPPPFETWCAWAKAGLVDALEGMRKSGGGVTEYHIGSRGLHRSGPADQIKNIDYWNEMVRFFCGVDGLPSSLTGRDTACRIIPRDV